MAYTTSKAYDLRNVQYQGTRIGGTDRISTCPIQYQGTPVIYMRYKNNNVMHRYTVWNGVEYKEEYDYDSEWEENLLYGIYKVNSLTEKESDVINTDIPYDGSQTEKISYDYSIAKYVLSRTSGSKGPAVFYLYGLTNHIRARKNMSSVPLRGIHKAVYLSSIDYDLNTLGSLIENAPTGKAYTSFSDLGIIAFRILSKTRQERFRTDEITERGNFSNFSNNTVDEEGTWDPWETEYDDTNYSGIFNQDAEFFTAKVYDIFNTTGHEILGASSYLNFPNNTNSKSEAITSPNILYYTERVGAKSDYSACSLNAYVDDRHMISLVDSEGKRYTADSFRCFSALFLASSSCSPRVLNTSENDALTLTYYKEYYSCIHSNTTYVNYIKSRDY